MYIFKKLQIEKFSKKASKFFSVYSILSFRVQSSYAKSFKLSETLVYWLYCMKKYSFYFWAKLSYQKPI